jgi:hypothetical protein
MPEPKSQDTQTEKIHLNYWQGGSQVSEKLGIANSFYSSLALDFRSDPAKMSVLPGMTNIGQNVTDLIEAMEQDLNGIRWGVGNTGKLWKINTSDSISLEATLNENGSAGILYNQLNDQLYIPGQTTVSMYGQVTTGNSGQPVFQPDIWAKSASTDAGCCLLFNTTDGFYDGTARNDAQTVGQFSGITDPTQVGNPNATNTYDAPSQLKEDAINNCFFAPDIEPFYSIAVYIPTVGTGDWTLTLHDSMNTQLATVTIVNGSMTTGWNEFVFGKQVRAIVNASQTGGSPTYHWHITTTVAGGRVAVIKTGDLSTANFLLFAYRLVHTQNGWHPMALFTGSGVPLLCIGNGNWLATYDFSNDAKPANTQFQRHRLQFKHGFEVCSMTTNNQYLVIGLERRSSNSSRNFQDGQLVFWSGANQANPDFIIDIPMGAPYGLQTFNNVTYFICAGSLFAWSGGQTVIKVRKLAYQNTDYLNAVDTTIVSPNMMAIRYNLLLLGYPSTTTNVNINYGVYSWGSVEVMYPNSLGLSYALSNAIMNNNTGGISNLKIGCVYNFVDSMYVPWQYTLGGVTYYGVDLLNNFSTPATNFNFRTLIYDGGVTYKIKNSLKMQLTFLSLPAGYTLQARYRVNRGADVLSPVASTGDTKIVFEIDNSRFTELDWGFVGSSSGATSPAVFTGLTMEIDPLVEEGDLSTDQTIAS